MTFHQSITLAPFPIKFSQWFALLSEATYANVSFATCNKTLADYHNNLYNQDRKFRAATCAWHQ